MELNSDNPSNHVISLLNYTLRVKAAHLTAVLMFAYLQPELTLEGSCGRKTDIETNVG